MRSTRGHTPRRPSCAAAFIALALVACNDSSARGAAAAAATEASPRLEHELSDTLWQTSVGDEASSPQQLTTDGRFVFVTEPSKHRIAAYDARTGRAVWRTDTVAEPHLRRFEPLIVAPRRAGGLLVLPSEGGAVMRISDHATLDGSITLSPEARPQNLCELPNGDLLLNLDRGSAGFLRTDSNGVVRSIAELPWKDLRAASTLLTQVVVAPTTDGCVASLVLGRGFARYRGVAFEPPRAYIESIDLPALRRTEHAVPNGVRVSTFLADHVGAANDIAVTQGRTFVSFAGRSAYRNHLIDMYDSSGAYVESFRFRTRIVAFSASDSALFILTRRSGAPFLFALRASVR